MSMRITSPERERGHFLALSVASLIAAAGVAVTTSSVDAGGDALIDASTSVCVTVPGANPGDVAVINITNTNADGTGYGALRSSDTNPVYDRPTNQQYSSVNFAANTPPNPNLAFTTIGTDDWTMLCRWRVD